MHLSGELAENVPRKHGPMAAQPDPEPTASRSTPRTRTPPRSTSSRPGCSSTMSSRRDGSATVVRDGQSDEQRAGRRGQSARGPDRLPPAGRSTGTSCCCPTTPRDVKLRANPRRHQGGPTGLHRRRRSQSRAGGPLDPPGGSKLHHGVLPFTGRHVWHRMGNLEYRAGVEHQLTINKRRPDRQWPGPSQPRPGWKGNDHGR